MVADTASGRYQDQPGYGAEARPDGPGSRPGDTLSVRSQRAENRDRAAYAEARPDRFAGRIRPEDLDGLRSMARAGEWRELVDLLVASLGSAGAAVTAGERGELRSLLDAMDLPAAALAGLIVAG